MSAKATLQDIADRIGVHRSTVSLALRDHPRISLEVRRKVQAAARRLGYRINPLISALMKSRRSRRPVKNLALAFVTNYPTRFGWKPEHHDRPDYFPGASDRARDFGYRLEHFWLGEPGMTPRRFCDMLSEGEIHGLIVGRLPPSQTTLDLAWERFSCVALGMTLQKPRLHHVTENHFDTICQAMQQCRLRGYRRVGLVFSEADDSPRVGDRWLAAYLHQQMRFPPADRIAFCPRIPADETGFATWLEETRPDAIIATHAKPVLAWLDKLGKNVPGDVGLVNLDHRTDSGCAHVHYDAAKIGALAVEMLVGLMHRNETGVPDDQHEILMTGVWRDDQTLPDRTTA
ncbi:MAG TPA: LacI family DNA-binding transcriptional regulator [Opitutaceae bacterium]|nr:LacI family DNA-binding transcriptional regulator [Opitutaceae bacterium]